MNKSIKFKCNTCGNPIEDPSHGWVEWLDRREHPNQDLKCFRVVHHSPWTPLKSHESGCHYTSPKIYKYTAHLTDFLEQSGLESLLNMIDQEDLLNIEVVEFIKRIHLRGDELVCDQSITGSFGGSSTNSTI